MKPSKRGSIHLGGTSSLSKIDETHASVPQMTIAEIHKRVRIHHISLLTATSKNLKMITEVSIWKNLICKYFLPQVILAVSEPIKQIVEKRLYTLLESVAGTTYKGGS
jgi:hypothetical protein